MSEDVNQADYFDDDNYQTAIPREERAELPQGENIPESTRRYHVRERRRQEYFYSVAGDELDDHVHVPNFGDVAGSEDFTCATLLTTPLDFQDKI